ncbi:hypothetical protein [Tahibacter soli]|uniref:Uncharacterized protein n=1 Tax=Tahibacter soli TaxID=2983605 RepID=A0A9X4BLG1_9GAMM|nr:hypothetical protein [Tahibacter soli]MDC8014219.1 hypothetical protein [Tahibacter soli]
MSLRALLAAAAVFVLLTGKVIAEPFAFVAAYDQIYRIDLATRQASLVGDNGRYGSQPIVFKGLAYAPNGALYGASDNVKALFRLDAPGSVTNFVGSLGLNGQGDQANFDALDLGLAIGCDSQQWLTSTYAQKLWKVDAASGATSFVGNLGAKITGIAAKGRELYGFGSRGHDGFYKIDTTTGAATLIKSYPSFVGNASSMWPAFDASGQLWVVITYMPPPLPGMPGVRWSDLAKVDIATGEMTVLGSITGPESLEFIGLLGVAIAPPAACPTGTVTPQPIPAGSPIGYALLAGLLALVTGYGLRRRAVKP